MGSPAIKVTLTPEGVADVIAAFRQVTAEAKKLDPGHGVGLLNNSLRELKELLPTIGLAAAVEGFRELVSHSLEMADSTGKMAEAFGGAVEDVSALTLAFRTNESDQDGLRTALSRTVKVLGDVRNGNQVARDSLAQLGLSADQLSKISAPRALESIAQALDKIENPTLRAAAAQQIFGKGSADLLNALKAVGEQGIDAFAEKARKLGVLIDTDLFQSAKRAKEAFADIKIEAEGLATQFAAGFAPAVADAMDTFVESVEGAGGDGMKKFGEIVGEVLRFVVATFSAAGKVIGAYFAVIVTNASNIAAAVLHAAIGDFIGAKNALAAGAGDTKAILAALGEDLAALYKKLADGPKELPPPKAPAPPGQDPEAALAELRKRQAAVLALRQQQAQEELALTSANLKSEEAAAQQLYAAGLISLQEYFDRRLKIINASNAAEVTELQKQRAALVSALNTSALKGGPDTDEAKAALRQKIGAIDAQLALQQVTHAREIASLDAERAQGLKDLDKELLSANTKLAEAENNRHQVFVNNLAAEIKAVQELGAKAGQSADEIAAQVARLTAARTSQFNFEEAARAGQQKLDAFNRDSDQIQRDQQAGVITQIEGQQRLLDLEAQRVPVLKALAAQLQAAADATGSDDLKEKALEFAASIDQIAASYRQASDIMLQFRSAAINSLDQGIDQLLLHMDKIKSAGDLFKELAKTVIQSLREIAAEIVAKQATLAIVNGATKGAGFLSTLFSTPGATSGGLIRAMARGGDVRGRELPIAGPDKIPIMGQKGEFMLRKARVSEPGALGFLRAWNEGRITLAHALRAPRFADGGMIGRATTAEMAAVQGPANASGGNSFYFPLAPDAQGRISRLTQTQIRASVAQGLAEANRRNN